jgi:hypothetical protein
VEFAEREERFQVRDAKKGSTHLDGSLTAA